MPTSLIWTTIGAVSSISSIGTAEIFLISIGVGGIAGLWDYLGISGDDSGAEVSPAIRQLAERLGTDPDETVVVREVEGLIDRVDRITELVDLERHTPADISRSSRVHERAIALESAIERGWLDIPSSSTNETRDRAPDELSDALEAAASRLSTELQPTSTVATDLLDLISTERFAENPEGILRDAVKKIEAHDRLERTFDAADPTGPDASTRIRNQLQSSDGAVESAVFELANALDQCRGRTESVEAERKQLAESVETIAHATLGQSESGDVVLSDDEATVVDRARRLADRAREGELSLSDPRVPNTAAEVSLSLSPESGSATDLLEALEAPYQATDLAGTLETAVELIDEAAINRGTVGETDRESVHELLSQVESRAEQLDGPVADVLNRRLSKLNQILENANQRSVVVPYAVKQEIRFYARDILDAMESKSHTNDRGSQPLDDVTTELEAVEERRMMIEEDYIEGRPDHNHSIPLHFISMAKDLQSDAEELAQRGRVQEATGVIDATRAIIGHVEQLYERNEYSVLLRRLRG